MSERAVLLVISGNSYPVDDVDHHTARIWFELAKGFDELHVFARAQDQRFHTRAHGPVTLHLIPRGPARMLVFVLTSWWLAVLAPRVRPTHLLAQSAVHGGLAAVTLGRAARRPVLVEVHGEYYLSPSASSPTAFRWWYRPLAGLVFRRATRIRSLSAEMSEHLVETYGTALADKIVEVPNRVDLEVFTPPKQDYAAGPVLRIISVGPLTSRKNHQQLIRDLAAGGHACELTLVGTGPEAEALRVEAAGTGVRVHLAGRLSHPQLAGLLREHDAYVHYSRSEAVPRAVLEAMAVGLPVVVTPVGYTGGVVVDGVTGLRLPSSGSLPLQQALVRLRSAAERERLGQAARRHVERHHEWSTVFDRYRRALQAMTQPRSAGGHER